MSDNIDARIELIEWLAEHPPPPDPINEALQQMKAQLAAADPPKMLHALLHTDPHSIYVGLSNAHTSVVEVSGGGYARQPYTGGCVKFPAATGSWGTIESIVIFGDDQPLATIPLQRAATITPGDNLQIDVNLSFS